MKITDVLIINQQQFIAFARKQKYINDIKSLQHELRIKKGQLVYVMEYLQMNPCKFVKQGDVLLYCDKRRNEDTNGEKPNFKDNSRAIEQLRKDKAPLRWLEVTKNGELYFMYCKNLETNYVNEIVTKHSLKKESFSKDVVLQTLKRANYKCQICGISANQVKLECDHWHPKEKCGESKLHNAVCLCCNCNPKKNASEPVEWFCKHFLNNFHLLARECGGWDADKKIIQDFLQEL